LPFEGEREQAVVYSIINEPHEPVTALRVGVPTELDRIVGKALAKNPAERYQHLDDMLVDLRALHRNLASMRATGARAPAKLSRWPRWARAALLPVLLLAGYLAWKVVPPPEPVEPLRALTLTTFPGVELYPSLSPDGNHMAFTWSGQKQENQDIYVQLIGSGVPLRLTTDPRRDLNPVWSPDGRWIAFLRAESSGPMSQSKRELTLIPPLGGPERKLAEIRVREITFNPAYLDWCPDSACLVVTDSPGEGKPDALFAISLETGEKEQLTSPQPPVIADTSPAVSPDGSSLVFRRSPIWNSGELYLLPLGKRVISNGEPRRLTPARLDADYPAWTPDGKEILFSAGVTTGSSLWRLVVQGASSPVRLPFAGEDGLMPVISRPQTGRAARLVYVRSFVDNNTWRIDTTAPGAPTSSPPTVAIASTRQDIHAQFSPDGRRVAFTSTRSGEWEIWLADPDGSNAVQLTSMGAQATGAPRWSPDGLRIVFASDQEDQFEIYEISAGGGRPRRLTSSPSLDHVPSFSRDGRWIYFSSNRTGDFQIWKMPVSGGEEVQVTSDGGWIALESPDGADLYYTQTVGESSALWRLPTSGGHAVRVLEGVFNSAFAVLEQGIYYVDRPAGEARLRFFSGQRSTTVAGSLGDFGTAGGFSVSPDGRTILYPRVDTAVDDLMLVENFR